MNYPVLRTELLGDPLGLGYVGESDAQAAATLNSLTTGRTEARTNVPGNDVLHAIVSADLAALTTNQLLQLLILLFTAGTDGLDASNANIRGDFTNIFTGKTTTLNALGALASGTVSRAQELNLDPVSPTDVTVARSGTW